MATVCRLEGALRSLVDGFLVELLEHAINPIDNDDRLDTFCQCVSAHGFEFHTNTSNTVDDDERAVGDTQSSRHFG